MQQGQDNVVVALQLYMQHRHGTSAVTFLAILRPKSNSNLVYDLPESGRSVTQVRIRPPSPPRKNADPPTQPPLTGGSQRKTPHFFELLFISMLEMMAGWVGRHFSEEGAEGANFKLDYRPA